MTSRFFARAALVRVAAIVGLFVALLTTASPASAQYGGTVDLFVDPTRVEIDGTFDYFGSSCPAGSTVTITIDGFPGVLDTTTTFDDSSYTGSDVPMPDGVVAGQDYQVRASCGGNDVSVTIRAVCNGGTDPVAGACPDGNTVGGQDPDDPPGATTTTTTPGGSGDPGGSGGSGGTGGTGPDLAVTGATFVEQAAQLGVTLLALGSIFVLLAAKRREEQPV